MMEWRITFFEEKIYTVRSISSYVTIINFSIYHFLIILLLEIARDPWYMLQDFEKIWMINSSSFLYYSLNYTTIHFNIYYKMKTIIRFIFHLFFLNPFLVSFSKTTLFILREGYKISLKILTFYSIELGVKSGLLRESSFQKSTSTKMTYFSTNPT